MKNENSPNIVSEDNRFAFFLHQDKLLWSRLQTLGVIQIATLGAAYSIKQETWLDIGVLVLGIILTLLVFLLIQRDELVRDKVSKSFCIGYESKRKWYAPLKGTEIKWLIMIFILLADFVMGYVVYKN